MPEEAFGASEEASAVWEGKKAVPVRQRQHIPKSGFRTDAHRGPAEERPGPTTWPRSITVKEKQRQREGGS